MNTQHITVSALTPDPTAIAHAAAIIRRGGLVAMPTETVYGLAGDATNPQAVAAIFAAKGRPTSDPLIVHIADMTQLAAVADSLPAAFALLSETFWPGPLTILVPKHAALSQSITAGFATVAVRMPNHPVALALIRACERPLVAPSANLFSRPSPTCAAHVLQDLAGRIDAVLDAGESHIGVESTIVDITTTPARILRHGGIPAEQLSTVLGDIEIVTRSVAAGQAAPAPGMLLKHYAPQVPLTIFRGSQQHIQDAICAYAGSHPQTAWLCYDEDVPVAIRHHIPYQSLGSHQQAHVVATRLFAALRALDTADVAYMVTSEPTGGGVAAAIRDRLFRAAEGRIISVDTHPAC